MTITAYHIDPPDVHCFREMQDKIGAHWTNLEEYAKAAQDYIRDIIDKDPQEITAFSTFNTNRFSPVRNAKVTVIPLELSSDLVIYLSWEEQQVSYNEVPPKTVVIEGETYTTKGHTTKVLGEWCIRENERLLYVDVLEIHGSILT